MRAAFYRANHAGWPGVYNRLVRWWTRSPYSHVEIIFEDGLSASASYMDGGVRFKRIEFDLASWDMVELPARLERKVRDWFERHDGQPYDLLGNLHFVISPVGNEKRKWFCSEACAAALGLPDPGRFDPGTLASALALISIQPATADLCV